MHVLMSVYSMISALAEEPLYPLTVHLVGGKHWHRGDVQISLQTLVTVMPSWDRRIRR